MIYIIIAIIWLLVGFSLGFLFKFLLEETDKRNYGRITEGKKKRGGQRPRPTSSRPSPPMPQNPSANRVVRLSKTTASPPEEPSKKGREK